MTENQPTQPAAPMAMPIDLAKVLPTVAEYYKKFSWLIPIAERIGGFKIPRELIQGLDSLASGKPFSAEDMAKLQTGIEGMKPLVGEPVMTRSLAQTAWFLHYKEGMGTRDIAEQFTKDGSPCSHATVARWINAIDEEKRFSKIAKLITVGKFLGYIGIVALAFLIGHWLW
jgi:hypothetical protein